MVDIQPQGLIPADQQPLVEEEGPQQEDPIQDQPQPHAPRIRRTHKDDFISSLLSKLHLREKLTKNKEIEDQNKVRDMRTYDHHLDPVLHPNPGSENASFITIDDADVKDLKDPSILARFSAIMPDFLLFHIIRENRAEKEEKDKRKLEESSPTSGNSQDVKRCRMDGSNAAERVVGSQRDIEFSDILFTTNLYVPIPLPFFRNENLRYLIDHAATLPTTKSNPLPGETKGQFILNIPELTKGTRDTKAFGEELSLDFGQWSEAAHNCFRFHQMQDKDGNAGDYAHWWCAHFRFFNAQEDKISQYDAWKELDLKLRREYRTEPTKFDIHHYATKYEAAKNTFELKSIIEKHNSSASKDHFHRNKDTYRPPNRGNRFPGSSRESRNFSTSGPPETGTPDHSDRPVSQFEMPEFRSDLKSDF